MKDFFAYYITNRASAESGTALRWSLRFATPAAARAWLKEQLDAGKATMGVIVGYAGPRTPGHVLSVHPPSASKVVDHYRQIVEHAAEGEPPHYKGKT